jgi:hypothetical protein
MARLSTSSIFFVGPLFVCSLLLIISEARPLGVVGSHGSINNRIGTIFSDEMNIEGIKNSGPSEGGRGHAFKIVHSRETHGGPSPGDGH